MDINALRDRLNGELHDYLKYAEIARISGGSRQLMNYWLKRNPKGSDFNPVKGILTLQMLCLKLIGSRSIDLDDYKQLKKFVNMSKVSEQFFNGSSSTVSITISRKGVDVYKSEIKQLAKFILKKLKQPVKKRKKKTRTVALNRKKQ